MKKYIYILLVSILSFSYCFAQKAALIDRSKEGQQVTQSQPKATPSPSVTPEKKKAKKNKHEGKVLSNGFALTAIVGGNRGLTNDGKYTLINSGYNTATFNSYTNTSNYNLENSFGYRFGMGIGFQTRGYGFEVPFSFNVDRFKVPTLSSDYGLKVSSLEFGINNYFKFLKAKHFIVFGPYAAFDMGIDDFGIHSYGLNLGYGYNFTKRLNLSLRYKFNFKSIIHSSPYNETNAIGYEKYEYESNFTRVSKYNSLQLILRFDLINTRRWRDPKSKTASYNTPYTPAPASTSTPAKIAIDYSTYTDENLKQALKDAKNLTDMNLIQIEMDKRKASANEFDKYNDTQLKELLNSAVAKEDYDRAEVIKNEIKNRETIQKNKPVDPNSLESKSIEELTSLLNAALAKEDYDKAAEIKAVIDKKK